MAFDIDKLRDKYKKMTEEKGDGQGNSENFLKLSEGSTMVRILPAKEDEDFFYVESSEHRFKWNNKIHYLTCLKQFNEPCPICDAVYKLWDMHNDLDLAKGAKSKYGSRAGTIKAKPRYFMNVLNRTDNSVKIYSAPEQVFKIVMQNMLGDDALNVDALGDVTDLENGYDLNIKAVKKGDFLGFETSVFRPKPSAVGDAKATAAILDQRHDLKALLKKPSYDEVKLLAQSLLIDEVTTEAKKDGEANTPNPVSDDDFKAKLNKKNA